LNIQIGNNSSLLYHDVKVHLHGTGLSQSGKSKQIELITRQFVRARKPYIVVDPNGSLYRNLLDWLAYTRPSHTPILFDAAYGERIPGYNPFRMPEEIRADYLMTKTERMTAATIMAGGSMGADGLRLRKFMHAIMYVLLQQRLPLSSADHFLNWHSRQRQSIIDKIDNEGIKEVLTKLYSGTQKAFETYIESTENRLQLFLHPHLRRIMGVADNCIDLEEIIENGQSLILNLQRSDRLSGNTGRILGTLFINELWELFSKRKTPKEFYLIIDECQLYFTPELGEMLEQASKYGLHLMLFHQTMEQIPSTHKAAIQNAQTKIEFQSKDFQPQERRFMLTRRNGMKYIDDVPLVKTYPLKPSTVAKYEKQLTKQYMTIEELDKALSNGHKTIHKKDELEDEDFYKRR